MSTVTSLPASQPPNGSSSGTSALPSTTRSTKASGGNSLTASTSIDAITASFEQSRLDSIDADVSDGRTLKQKLLEHGVSSTAQNGEDASSSKPNLASFLKGRVAAEGGETVLTIGGKDSDGSQMQLDADEFRSIVSALPQAATEVGIQATFLLTKAEERLAHVLLRQIPNAPQDFVEIRVACVGNVDAGKSTTLGVLTRGGLDDGRGKARVNLFRHKHEIETGRTSSVGMELLGLTASGDHVINATPNSKEEGRKISWEEICARSAKIVNFLDLAGHERYLRTTIGGLTANIPEYGMLMVGANAGLIGMSKEHLGVALALSIPVFVTVTKVDMCPPQILEATIKQLTKVLKSPGCRKTPVFVENMEQVIDCALRLSTDRICPIVSTD